MKDPVDVADWVREEVGLRKPVDDTTSLQAEGVFGDDMHELMDAYAERFGVNMDRYLWYFHTGEEGMNPGALFWRPPYACVTEIPITVGMLREFAASGKWSVDYPEHRIPSKRIDLAINSVFGAVFLVGIGALLVWKYFS